MIVFETQAANALTSVVHEDGAKVANNVNDEEDRAILALHGKVATASVARYWRMRCEIGETLIDGLG